MVCANQDKKSGSYGDIYDVYEIWSDYGQGWEVECEGEDKADAKRLLKEYNENAPQWPHKLRHRRIPKDRYEKGDY